MTFTDAIISTALSSHSITDNLAVDRINGLWEVLWPAEEIASGRNKLELHEARVGHKEKARPY